MGFQLLAFIEQTIGYPNTEDFLTYYVYNNMYTSVDSFQVREMFREFIPTVANGNSTWVNEMLSMVDWDAWQYTVGPDPTHTLNFMTPNNTQAVDLANAYIANGGNSNPSNYMDYVYWPSPSQVLFHDTLLNQVPSMAMTEAIMNQIDNNYNVTYDTNPEVKQRWYTMAIFTSYTGNNVMNMTEDWIGSMGRLKYLEPIYYALMQNDMIATADLWFSKYGASYSITGYYQILNIVSGTGAKKHHGSRNYRK